MDEPLMNATRRIPTARARFGFGYLAGAFILAAFSLLPAAAQQARWYQLSEQVLQLREQGKAAEALPLAQETVRVAEQTFGPDNPHVGLSLNELGLLLTDEEKFADAETAYRRALSINEKAYGESSTQAAAVLNNIADLYRIQGRYGDAEKLFQQAMSIQEKALGPDDPEVAVNAGNLALVYVAEGKYADAEPLYRRVIAIDVKAKGPQDSSVATDDNNLADLYVKQAKYADAQSLQLQALSIDIKAHGNEHPEVAADLANLGGIFIRQGKFASAEPVFLRALAIDQKALGADNSTVAWIMEGLGTVYRDESRYAEAEPLFQRSLAIREKVLGPNHPDVASTLDNLGGLCQDEGRYNDAESNYRRAIDIRVKALGPSHPLLALSLSNLALLYKEQGKWGQAEGLYRQAMAIDLKTLGQENPQVAVVLNNVANLYADEGKLADAERLLRGAVAIDEKAYGPDHPITAQNLNNLAEVYEDEGKPAEAEPLYQHSLAIAEESLGPNHPQVAADLIGLASAYEDEGKYPEAEPLFKRALAIDEGVLGPDHPTTGEVQMNMAVFYDAWDKPDLAEPYFDKRITNLMSQFRTNATYMSEKDRLIFLATVPGAFPLYFSFALRNHDRDPALAGKVYDILLQEKGFIAASAAALRAKILASGDQETLGLLNKLTAEKTQLAGLVSSTQGDPGERRKLILQLEQETNQLEQEIVKRSSSLAEEKTLSAVTWRDVQKALKPGEAAVEFARFPFNNGKHFTATVDYIALVVTPQSKNPDFIVLGEAQKLEAAPIADYRAHVGQTRGLSAEPEPGAPAVGPGAGNTSAAYDAFWKPLEPALGGAKRVYVSPDGVLNQIPIGLLADDGGKLLLEKYQLRYVNSTKDLLRPRRTSASKTAVLLGNPRFDLTEAEQRAALAELNGGAQQHSPVAAPPTPSGPSGQRSVDLSGGALNPLPGTQAEVSAIERLLKNSAWLVTPYTGGHALEEVVDKLHSPRIAHIATHGFFLSDQQIAQKSKTAGGQPAPIEDPMLRSGLFFAGADRIRSGAAPAAGIDDGVLTAYEASQLDLEGTELVVLSACETGLGQQSNGEGVFGLRRGLQEAGADAVMMSMWSVPDRETQELMALFYAKWLGGMDKPEALRQAQLEERETVRQRYGKDLPFYWGAFVLVGR
jgi:CHAT domain-containing protein/Tfp pilus assembly protein PilF